MASTDPSNVIKAGIRENLALPEAADQEANRALADVITHSQEAYKSYLQGIDAMEELDFNGAARLLTQAVEHDSTFAMAYLRLSRVQRVRGLTSESNRAAEKAARFVEHATPLERFYVESERALADGQPDRSVTILREIINRYIALVPDEPNPYDIRSDLYAHYGHIDDAIASYQMALRKKVDFYPAVMKLGHMHLFRREYATADSVYRRYFQSNTKEDHSMGRMYQALIPMAQGHLHEAIEMLDQGIAADGLEKLAPLYPAEKRLLRVEVLDALGRYDDAFTECGKSLRLYEESGARLRFYPASVYISCLAKAGKFAEASDSLASLQASIRQSDTTRMRVYNLAAAKLAMAQGHYDEAITLLKGAVVAANPFVPRFELASACFHAGQLGEATSEFKEILKSFDEYRAVCIVESVRAHYLLGQAYEQSGWKGEALIQYREFLECWGSADPELKEVADARSRIVRLQTTT